MKASLCLILLLVCSAIVLAQQPQSAAAKTDTAGPIASALDPDEAKKWQELQQPINESNALLTRSIQIAQLAAPKTSAEKANLWADLEMAFIRGSLAEKNFKEWLATMQAKYNCERCAVEVAPDGKTLVIKPASPVLSYSR